LFPHIKFNSEVEKQEAAQIIIPTRKSINDKNKKFKAGEINFESKIYDFHHKNYEQFKLSNMGIVAEPDVIIELADETLDIESSFSVKYPIAYPECQNLPESRDWAAEGKVTSVLSQAPCGDCFMFASSTVLESHAAISAGKSPVLTSRQNTLECVKKFAGNDLSVGNIGCNGGRPEWIFRYARELGGLVSETTYLNYTANPTGACVENLEREVDTEVDHWEKLPSLDEDAMKCFVARHGPLAVEITVGGTSLLKGKGALVGGVTSYSSGVWEDIEGACTALTPVDHAGEFLL
jgi:Papain family cysteine protease